MQQSSGDPHRALAHRLRELRLECWPGHKLTQRQIADALGVSVPSVSAWENQTNVPPESWLEAYARFFATERSVSTEPFQLLAVSQLKPPEKARRSELLHELVTLRNAALHQPDATTSGADEPSSSLWHFRHDHNVTIICSELPDAVRRAMRYTDPDSPDYVELYRYADLDALIELYGHIRSVNPANHVYFRTASELTTDDYTTHLVLLGGVDWNAVTADMLYRLDLPVRQVGRDEESDIGGFEVIESDKQRVFRPVLRKIAGHDVLVEDVAHFYRGLNPFNRKRTITICNGMFQRGTLGAVRTLTDPKFRDRNEAYVKARFPGRDSFSMVVRVLIANGVAVTPDWSSDFIRLHEWPGREEVG